MPPQPSPLVPVRTTPKIDPRTTPDPERRVNPKRICPDQITRTVDPLWPMLP